MLDCLNPLLEAEEERTKEQPYCAKAALIKKAFANLYMKMFSLIHYPMFVQEMQTALARDFIESVSTKLEWCKDKKAKQILYVEHEIATTGTYNHTSEEIEMGAQLAWWNSAKCIGRIVWRMLVVHDMRHIDKP